MLMQKKSTLSSVRMRIFTTTSGEKWAIFEQDEVLPSKRYTFRANVIVSIALVVTITTGTGYICLGGNKEHPLPNDAIVSDVSTAQNTARKLVRAVQNVNVRSSPSLDGEIISDVSAGSYGEYLGQTVVDDRNVAWYLIETRVNHRVGWVSSKYASLE